MKNLPVKMKISVTIFYLLSLVTLVFGFMYLLRDNVMPYHVCFLSDSADSSVGTAFMNKLADISPRIVELYLGLMKIVGGSFIAIGVAAIYLVSCPLVRGEKYAWWTLLIIYSISLLPTVYVTYSIASQIPEGGIKPPYILTIGMFVMNIVALILSKKHISKA